MVTELRIFIAYGGNFEEENWFGIYLTMMASRATTILRNRIVRAVRQNDDRRKKNGKCKLERRYVEGLNVDDHLFVEL